jgi:hypothetical protein
MFESLLKQINPDYEKLSECLIRGPSFSAISNFEGSGDNVVTILEVWGGDVWIYQSDDFSVVIDWVKGRLEHWVGCDQIDANKWVFKNQSDTEKFITLFNLRWS